MHRHLPGTRTLTVIAALATFSTASAEEGTKPATASTSPAMVITEKASPLGVPTRSNASQEALARTCGDEAVGFVEADGATRCKARPAVKADSAAQPPRQDGASLLAGTYYLSIPAIACVAQGTAPSGDTSNCGGGGTLRTDGDNAFPCVVRSVTTRATYVCGLDLPSSSQIQEVIAYGTDYSTVGYFEASIWSTADASFGPNYFSSFGGTWQSSGVAFSGGPTSFPIFSSAQPAHTVAAGNRYVIGFAMRDAIGSNSMNGFRVRYYVP